MEGTGLDPDQVRENNKEMLGKVSKLPNLIEPPKDAKPMIRMTPWEKMDPEAKVEWVTGVNCKNDAIRWYLKWMTDNERLAVALAELQEFRLREAPEQLEKIEVSEFEKKWINSMD